MKNKFLISGKFLIPGILLIALGLLLGIAYLNEEILSFLKVNSSNSTGFSQVFERDNYQGDLAITMMMAGLYFTGFSKLKNEDEYTDYLRYQSILFTIVLQTISIILCSWLVGGIQFYSVSTINLFGFLFIYNLCFRIVLYINRPKATE